MSLARTSSCSSASPQSGSLPILLLALSAFVVVTTEFVIVGFLPSLARDLSVSVPSAGGLVTLFAFTVMLLGPVMTARLSHIDRKQLFIGLLGAFAVANIISALAPNIWVLGAGRLIAALALPVFWGMASDSAAALAGPQRASRAIANVYFGIAAAMVLGIPIGTLLAAAIGWRGVFWALAGLAIVMAALLHAVMPSLRIPEEKASSSVVSLLKRPRFLAHMALSALAFTASFTAYTYLADLLERVVLVPSTQVGWWLMGFGVVGLFGNWLGGVMSRTHAVRATGTAAAVLALGTASLVPLAHSPVAILIPLALWGIANTALYPICQIQMMRAAPSSQAVAGTLNVSMAQAGIGLGAIVGGAVIDSAGIGLVGYAAAVTAVGCLIWSLFLERVNAP